MEDNYQHNVEDVFKHMLLRRLTITLGKRVQRTGKLILFKVVNHNIELTIGEPRDAKSHTVLQIPYPFAIKHDNQNRRVTLQYNVQVLFPTLQFATLSQAYKPNKILNNSYTITYE